MQKLACSGKWWLAGLGFLLICLCLVALALGDLRKHAYLFVLIFFAAFALYAAACFLMLQWANMDRSAIIGIFGASACMLGILVFSRPALSDDMYRYIWDGRVQAHGISPYRYPPQASELAFLRDPQIYPSINRKAAVTIYPPAAEAAFFVIWSILPDNIHWFQIVMAGGALLAGLLLVGLLRDLGRPGSRALLFLWSPLLIFETAHSAHVDGLVLPFLIGAWWARVREKDGWVGFLLGVATAIKLYPALLLPFLWHPAHPKGRWRMPLAFAAALGLFYLPYLLANGSRIIGYLPNYFQELSDVSPLVFIIQNILGAARVNLPGGLILFPMLIIAVLAIWCSLHPPANGEAALRRCIWPIGAITLLSQDLFAWYMLWLLPLAAIFLQAGARQVGPLRLPRMDAWTGWWLFCGLVGLIYFSYNPGLPIPLLVLGVLAEFVPLYYFLIRAANGFPWKKILRPAK
jgi:alpha-1,6-mannosyltransferase